MQRYARALFHEVQQFDGLQRAEAHIEKALVRVDGGLIDTGNFRDLPARPFDQELTRVMDLSYLLQESRRQQPSAGLG